MKNIISLTVILLVGFISIVPGFTAEKVDLHLMGPHHLLFNFAFENNNQKCSDRRDNDRDGLVDCNDSDCVGTDVCINSCTNGLFDFGEYWIDCGGTCGACPTCVDGIKNGNETGVDCGGTCLSCSATGSGQTVDIKNTATYGYNFRIYLPPGYSHSGSFPLIVFLHGAGERGENLDRVAVHGPLKHVNASWWNYNFVIIAPQVPSGGGWNRTLVKQLYYNVKSLYTGIDPSRVYITGLSMGGYGVNSIMQNSDNDWVTANAEICGGIAVNQSACNYKATPSWSFACDWDPTVTSAYKILEWSKILHGEDSSYSCGNTEPNPKIHMSLFDCGSHDSWSRVYDPFRNASSYILSTDRDVNSAHQFQYGTVNNVPPLYDWFLHSRK